MCERCKSNTTNKGIAYMGCFHFIVLLIPVCTDTSTSVQFHEYSPTI